MPLSQRSAKKGVLTINGRFVGKKPTGVQRYAREILFELDKLLVVSMPHAMDRVRLVVDKSRQVALDLKRICVINTPHAGGFVWTQAILPFYSEGVLLSLENIACLSVGLQILCVHDMNTAICPESYTRLFRAYYGIMVPLSLRCATSIVTVSTFSAQQIIASGHCLGKQVLVIPNGHEHVKRWDASKSQIALPSRPFVFVLGSEARHKNLKIIKDIAYALDKLGLDILVAGPKEKSFTSIGVEQAASNIRNLGYVSDDDLAHLFQNAFCFAFPSLTEGFGLPALEALSLGCPVIASNVASLPEVCGEAALYADPLLPDSWIAQIRRLFEEPDLRASLTQRGKKQALRFSWTQSASLYLELILETSKEIKA